MGKGYSPEFVANFDQVAARLACGEDILVQDGPDDICQPLLCIDSPHCLGESVRMRDARSRQDLAPLLGRSLAPGEVLTTSQAMLDRFRDAFACGKIRAACSGCEWFGLCSTVAVDRYRASALIAHTVERISDNAR